MHRSMLRLPAVLMMLCGATAVWAFSSGPPVTRTNAPAFGIYPAETNCTSCHSGSPLNDPNGSVQILDIPYRYIPGQSYPLRLRLSYSLADTTGASNPKWGFELTAINPLDGKGAGTLVLPNPGAGPGYPDSLLIKTSTSGTFSSSLRQYIEQSIFSTRTDQPSPAEWTFKWVAPSVSPGKVRFYVSGNATNGNASTSGDHVVTGSDSTDVYNPAVPATSPTTTAALLLLLVSIGAGALLIRRRPA